MSSEGKKPDASTDEPDRETADADASEDKAKRPKEWVDVSKLDDHARFLIGDDF